MVASPTTSSGGAGPMMMSPTETNRLEVVESRLKVSDPEVPEPTPMLVEPEPVPEQEQVSTLMLEPVHAPMQSSGESHEDASVQTPTMPTPMPTPPVPDQVVEDPLVEFDVDGTSVTIPHSILKGDVIRLRRFLSVAIPDRSQYAKLPVSVAARRRNMIRQDQYLATRRIAPPTMGSCIGKTSRRRTHEQTALLRAIKTLLRRLEAELSSEPGVEADGTETDEIEVAN